MPLRIPHSVLLVHLVVELEDVYVQEDEQLLNVALRLRQFANDCLALTQMVPHIFDDCVQTAQLETETVGCAFPLDTNDGF